MWKFISLSFMEYRQLTKAIEEFIANESKLCQLQATGHFPLILSEGNEGVFNVTVAPGTLDVLSRIDSRFGEYKEGVEMNTIDVSIFDSHQILLGHKESFRKYVLKQWSVNGHNN